MSGPYASDDSVFVVTSRASRRRPVLLVSIVTGRRYGHTTYLAFGIRPEIHPAAEEIIHRGIGPLV
jgi:hypothetical protein